MQKIDKPLPGQILTLYAQRPIVDKHARYAFHRPSAEAFASMATDMPYKVSSGICPPLSPRWRIAADPVLPLLLDPQRHLLQSDVSLQSSVLALNRS
jgi:hypothetical protein